MTRVLALTGVTGALGGRVAAELAATAARDGVALRLVVRDAARAPAVPGADVVEVPAGYADGPALTAALAGAHTVLLVSAAEAEDRLAQHVAAVDAAAAAGAERVVSRRTTFPPRLARSARAPEGGRSTPPPRSGSPPRGSAGRRCATPCTPTSCRSSPRSRTAPR